MEIQIYDKKAFAHSKWQVEKLASGFQFTEGPLWHRDGYLLFSDIPANRIYALLENRVEIFLEPSGYTGSDGALLSDMIGSNGLAWNKENELIVCQHGDHALARLDKNKMLRPLTKNFDGRAYNSPNDLAIRRDGSIWFTDPPYGLRDQKIHPEVYQPSAGVYRYKSGRVQQMFNSLEYPNGICFSPDERYAYVSSNHPDEPHLWRYELSRDGEIQSREVLVEINADGIKTDKEGRILMATNDGIFIISPVGADLALIPIPESPSNLAWGGENYEDLYITARSSIYRISNYY
jgi:gluconolactonase